MGGFLAEALRIFRDDNLAVIRAIRATPTYRAFSPYLCLSSDKRR